MDVSSLLRKLGVADRRALASLAAPACPRVTPFVPQRPAAPLPAPLTPFVGRAAEREALAVALTGHRLVTVVAPGRDRQDQAGAGGGGRASQPVPGRRLVCRPGSGHRRRDGGAGPGPGALGPREQQGRSAEETILTWLAEREAHARAGQLRASRGRGGRADRATADRLSPGDCARDQPGPGRRCPTSRCSPCLAWRSTATAATPWSCSWPGRRGRRPSREHRPPPGRGTLPRPGRHGPGHRAGRRPAARAGPGRPGGRAGRPAPPAGWRATAQRPAPVAAFRAGLAATRCCPAPNGRSCAVPRSSRARFDLRDAAGPGRGNSRPAKPAGPL